MADYYIDISAIGIEYQAYAAAPAWGAGAADKPLPQDGTGKAGPGHAAAVAIAEIKINALPADSNTLTIAGAVLTAKTAAAAKNQWTIGASVSACATNLVALLNTFGTGTAQCDAAVSSSVSPLLLALPYFAYARVKPGATDTVQIATRFAGSDLNHAINSFIAISSASWATPPTITQFAGGADGPFAYLMTTATVFGKTAGTYGAWIAASGAGTDPGANDVRHVRTRRSGADLSLTYAATTGTWAWRQGAFLYDNGTVWAGDNGKLGVTIQNTNTGSNAMRFTGTASGRTVHASRGYRNLDLTLTASGGANSSVSLLYPGAGGQFGFVRCGLLEGSNNIGSIFAVDESGAQFSVNDFNGSFVELQTVSRILWRYASASCSTRLTLNGLRVEVVGATATLTAIASFVNTTAAAGYSVQWIGGSISPKASNSYTCTNPFSVNVANQTSEFEIQGVVGVTDPSVGFTATAGPAKFTWSQTEGQNRGYRHEAIGFVCDWKGGSGFPHCGALTLQGDPWSHRVTWGAVSGLSASVSPMRTSIMHRSAAAVRTLTLQLYVPDTDTIYTDELELEVSYMSAADGWKVESVGGARGLQLAGSGRTALAASAKTWTPNGVPGHSAKKLEVTTAFPVMQNSEMLVRWSLCASRTPALLFYVSPEVEIA
ncbi:hypothetical protein HNQ51_001758 [Inhella inkyongensis]|uniref:Uncharacterized protein n=1 Tax=Inhella inkyongensis TaxID=392593 RepID=A0A840S6N0_9BURK|nr:hypothetical protein [Inhella inkyongensis]MBB5204444.1 hypothetical protein [Inhella inkyongensis]